MYIEKNILDMKDVCKLLGLTRQTIMRYVKEGKLKRIEGYTYYKFTKEEIERFLKT